MSMCRVFSCVVGRGCLLWPVRSLGKTQLAFALLHSVFQGQICLLLQVSLDFLLLHFNPLKWKGHYFLALVLEGFTGHHFSFFSVTVCGLDLDYCEGFDSKWEFAPPTVLLWLFLCPWMWGMFFVPIQHSADDGCSQQLAVWEFSREKMNTHPSTLPSLLAIYCPGSTNKWYNICLFSVWHLRFPLQNWKEKAGKPVARECFCPSAGTHSESNRKTKHTFRFRLSLPITTDLVGHGPWYLIPLFLDLDSQHTWGLSRPLW